MKPSTSLHVSSRLSIHVALLSLSVSLLARQVEPQSLTGSGTLQGTSSSIDPELVKKALTNYQHTLPWHHLKRGLVYQGANFRLRRVVNDLLTSKRQVKVGIVGGSISWGEKATERGVNDWSSVLRTWLQYTFGPERIIVKNGCIPGSPSHFMVLCLEKSVDPDTDMVFAEYLVNDGYEDKIYPNAPARNYERLVRRVLSLPSKPAMAMMQMPSHGMTDAPDSPHRRLYMETIEDVEGAIAQFYDTNWLSFRTATYHLASHYGHQQLSFKELMGDVVHPSTLGHKVMADLAIYAIQQTIRELVEVRPYGAEDEQLNALPLPAPMYPGNVPNAAAICLHQEQLKQVVTAHDGWSFVNEGNERKPKWGYVSTTPGKVLELRINTTRGAQGVEAGAQTVTAVIAYLKSYQHMGKATISCTSGCQCTPKLVDAHHTLPESQTFLAKISVTQDQHCVLHVTISDATSSGEHKFKVSGIMVNDDVEGRRTGVTYMYDGMWGHEAHVTAAMTGQNPIGYIMPGGKHGKRHMLRRRL